MRRNRQRDQKHRGKRSEEGPHEATLQRKHDKQHSGSNQTDDLAKRGKEIGRRSYGNHDRVRGKPPE